MKIEEIQEALKDRKISVMAKRTGIAEATLRSIARGSNVNPTYANYMALVNYFTGGDNE